MDIYNFFRNVCSPLYNKDITAFLRHPEQCLIPPQQIDFVSQIYRLVLEIFKFFEKHAQNLNTQQHNSVIWDLQMRFNSAFKGLVSYFMDVCVCVWGGGAVGSGMSLKEYYLLL